MITPAYLETQKALHATPRGYGGKGDKWADAVVGLIDRFDAKSVLDYGCGQGSLIKAVRQKTQGVELREYDPAIPGKDGQPACADLVVCTDVLEHIEPVYLCAVIDHLKSLAREALFVVIATRPSNKTLTDGRNAHLIVQTAEWWEQTFVWEGFAVQPDPPMSPLAKPSREWVAVLT